MMRIFDSHAHLTDGQFGGDLANVIQSAGANNIKGIICVADTLESSEKAFEISEKYDWIYPTAGIHPHYAQKVMENDVGKLKDLFQLNKKYVAVGETGLDFYYGKDIKEHQVKLFNIHLDVAIEFGLPVIIHCRESEDVILNILKDKPVKGLFHCFSGDAFFCEKVIDMGFYVSFSGIITFKNAQNVKDAAKIVPPDRLLIETDSPYLAPEGYRGKRNEPSYLVKTLNALADIRGLQLSDLAEATYKNTESFFKINIKVR